MNEEESLDHFGKIDRSYPGMRRWIEFYDQEDGVLISVFDLDVSRAPVYVFPMSRQYLVDFLGPEFSSNACLTPGFSAEEYLIMLSTGDLPTGVK